MLAFKARRDYVPFPDPSSIRTALLPLEIFIIFSIPTEISGLKLCVLQRSITVYKLKSFCHQNGAVLLLTVTERWHQLKWRAAHTNFSI
jgi:hypothetical protein